MMNPNFTKLINKSKKIVIKVGSSLIVDNDSGHIKSDWFDFFAKDLKSLKDDNKKILIVSSGAISLGRKQLGLKKNLSLDEKQAAAAVGQINLLHAWKNYLKSNYLETAQILLAPDDTETRKKYINARATLEKLLDLDVIPVINENDTISTQEIKFGDNDRLAARVAQMSSADLLILLSDISGLYSTDPNIFKNSKLIKVVKSITDEIENMAGPSNSHTSSGGMVTKIEAAKIATNAGCDVIISDGKIIRPISFLKSKKATGSWFVANKKPYNSRKQWISAALQVKGKIIIDQGATEAIFRGKSILPAGVINSEGRYDKGDLVDIVDLNDKILGKGLSHYNSTEVNLIKGAKTQNIEKILGYRGKDEIIHKDDFVLK